jgi:homoserine kinase type II
MADPPASSAVAPALAAYDLAPPVELSPLSGGTNNPVLLVRTGAGEFVWKGYATQADRAAILNEHRLLGWLADRGLSFAVPAPVPARDGETLCPAPGGWQALFVRLPGSRPDSRDPAQIEMLGTALGELHTALAAHPHTPRPGGVQYGDLDRIHHRVPDPYTLTPTALGLPDAPPYAALIGWWREALGQVRAFADGPYRALPRQVIHGDLSIGNFLTRDGRVTAILDFEFAGLDARALDLAAGLKYTMRTWENREPLVMARAFCRGYARRAALTADEVEALPWLLRLRDATSSVWWLGRALAAGDAHRGLERIEDMQDFARWLAEHERRLLDIARETLVSNEQ